MTRKNLDWIKSKLDPLEHLTTGDIERLCLEPLSVQGWNIAPETQLINNSPSRECRTSLGLWWFPQPQIALSSHLKDDQQKLVDAPRASLDHQNLYHKDNGHQPEMQDHRIDDHLEGFESNSQITQ